MQCRHRAQGSRGRTRGALHPVPGTDCERSMTALLETRAVERTFRVGRQLFQTARTLRAVNGVSLRIDKGEILGLVGESGCGKSTLAKMLLGLLEPTAGEILFEGQPLYSIPRLTR